VIVDTLPNNQDLGLTPTLYEIHRPAPEKPVLESGPAAGE
jgi:hypothetical protein